MPAALVTGSARGIGRALVLALAADGYDVAVHYRGSREDAERTRAEAAALGVRAVALRADVASAERAGALVGEAHAALGGLDVLVNNVGDYVLRPLAELTLDEWRHMLDSNLESAFGTCQAAVPLMQAAGGGRIVSLGYAGAASLAAKPSIVAYQIAKVGVVLLTRAIAAEFAADGITANVVAPGVIETSRTQPAREIPMGRVGRVDEVVAAVRYLLSAEAAYVTGQVIEVAGGWNL